MTKKGLHDPWRLYSPDREKDPDEKTSVGTPTSTHPLDLDLLPHQEYVFRHPRSTGDLLIYGADNAMGAAQMLFEVIQTMPAFHQILKKAGFLFGAVRAVQTRGFVIRAGKHILCLPTARSVADGLSRLVTTIRRSEKYEQLKKAGIIPLLK